MNAATYVIIALVVTAALLFVQFSGPRAECEAKGGVMVRPVFGFPVCVKVMP